MKPPAKKGSNWEVNFSRKRNYFDLGNRIIHNLWNRKYFGLEVSTKCKFAKIQFYIRVIKWLLFYMYDLIT